MLGQHAFDVAITDLCLPDACGLDAVVRIRQGESPVPLVVLTPNEDVAWSDQALQAGAQDVLCTGEIDADNLLRSMRHARGRQRAHARLHHGALHDELTSLPSAPCSSSASQTPSRAIGAWDNTFAVIYIVSITSSHQRPRTAMTWRLRADRGEPTATSCRARVRYRSQGSAVTIVAILLDTLDGPAEAENRGSRSCARSRPPFRVSQHELEVTAIMGISVFPQGGTGRHDLLRTPICDVLRQAGGRNTYSLTPLIDEGGMTEHAPPPPHHGVLGRLTLNTLLPVNLRRYGSTQPLGPDSVVGIRYIARREHRISLPTPPPCATSPPARIVRGSPWPGGGVGPGPDRQRCEYPRAEPPTPK